MTDAAIRVPAVGGTRTVPAPDPIARDYILLALRLDQHVPGLVDGYFGPADLKAQVDMEARRAPDRLRDDASALRVRLAGEVPEPDRRGWLDAQLVALESHAASLAGEPLSYLEHVERCLAWTPPRRPDAEFEAAAARIETLLPGDGTLADRLAAWDAGLELPVERLPALLDWLIGRFRARARSLFGLPEGEDLRVALVRGQPWSGYNWYDGGLTSRVDLNTDLPARAPELVHVTAHETFPGHHLEHAWKEADLVEGQGRLESSILLINTPECLISEGLADVGRDFAAPPDELPAMLEELFERAHLPIAADPPRARETAERAAVLSVARAGLSATRGNAALMRHADGATHEEVLDYLVSVGRFSPAVAAKRLEFIEHPLWRTYVFVYSDGEALLRRWLDLAPEWERPARFARLLHEQLTPGAILAELDDAQVPSSRSRTIMTRSSPSPS
jgi:hypothetical protein